VPRAQVRTGSGSEFQYLAPPPTLADLARSVPAMVLGEIVTSQARVLANRPESGLSIVTHEVRIVELLKDDTGELETVTTFRVSQTSGTPQFPVFSTGQRLILFLDKWPAADSYGVMFGANGTLPIDGNVVEIPPGIGRISDFGGKRTLPLGTVLDVLRIFHSVQLFVNHRAPPPTLAELWIRADSVALGEVVSSEQRLLPNDTPIVVHQLRAIEILKEDGSATRRDTFAFAQYGGRVFANGRLHISDQTDFPVLGHGQRAVLFLTPWPAAGAFGSGPYYVFLVRGDAVAVPQYVADHVAPFSGRRSLPLEEFLTMLRAFRK
jgi:hypothetical protein